MAIELPGDLGVVVIGFIVWLYSIITLPIYTILTRPWIMKKNMKRQRAVRIFSSQECVIYRKPDPPTPLLIEMKRKNVDTMAKLFQYAADTHGETRAMGTRQIIRELEEEQPNGKTFKKLDQGEYSWRTYVQANLEATNIGRGLVSLGVKPRENIVIFADTRAEWYLTAMGAFKQSIAVCTLYSTLGEEAILHGITETDSKLIVTSTDLLPKVAALLSQLPKVSTVVYFEETHKLTDPPADTKKVVFKSYNDVVKLGRTAWTLKDSPPTKDDTAIIMYTSGSTGLPKGVIISHSNITHGIFAFAPILNVKSNDIYIAYLPLAHVLELMGESVMMVSGVQLGYSSPFTLTDSSSMVKRGCHGDATVLKPTYLAAVPLIFDRIYKAAFDKAASKGTFSRRLFGFLIRFKISWMRRGWETPILNRVFFKRFRMLMGGNIRGLGCGGAPLSPNTHNFVRSILGSNACQGYGLTETCGCGAMMDLEDDYSTGRVGAPLVTVDIKLIDWEEGGYSIHDKPNPRGEIVIGGGNVAVGYYKNPEKTAECFYEEDGKRWFKTGDIGEFYSDGSLAIIDRKKDLVKLQHGEYVSLGKVESALKLCPYVENICVYGESSKNSIIAIVSPDHKGLQRLAKSYNKSDDVEELVEDKEIVEAVMKDLKLTAKKGKLQKFEYPVDLLLSLYPWTPDTKLVTATFKLQRNHIRSHYKKEIEEIYSRHG